MSGLLCGLCLKDSPRDRERNPQLLTFRPSRPSVLPLRSGESPLRQTRMSLLSALIRNDRQLQSGDRTKIHVEILNLAGRPFGTEGVLLPHQILGGATPVARPAQDELLSPPVRRLLEPEQDAPELLRLMK